MTPDAYSHAGTNNQSSSPQRAYSSASGDQAQVEDEEQDRTEEAVAAALLILAMGAGVGSPHWPGMPRMRHMLVAPAIVGVLTPILVPYLVGVLARAESAVPSAVSPAGTFHPEPTAATYAVPDHTSWRETIVKITWAVAEALETALPSIVDRISRDPSPLDGGKPAQTLLKTVMDTAARIITTTGMNSVREQLGGSMGYTHKVWRTRLDDRVRTSHALAEGQLRELGTPFRINGGPMDYPGDRDAPIGEWINCRCRIQLAIVSDPQTLRQGRLP